MNEIRKEKEITKNNQWDDIFKREGEVFPEIQEDMPEVVEGFKKEGIKKVLDLGCGAGRHSIYLAENGFDVSGFDASPEGVKITEERLKKEGFEGDFRVGDIYDKLPYPDGTFDAIVSTQVLNHGTIENIRNLIKEIERILAPNGIIFITVARRDPNFTGQAQPEEKIAPDTFVPLTGSERGLIHYYFDDNSLKNEFKDFNPEIWEPTNGRHYGLLGKLKK